MNFDESVCFLDEIGKGGSTYGLDSILRLLSQLGNPQDQLKVIHIAGTNGKGSVSNLLFNILIESGYKVGLFNSPNILSYRETIHLNHTNIPEEAFAKITSQVRVACETLLDLGHPFPTAFECFTAIALVFFYQQKVNLAIIEVGLGGTHDSTNVFKAPLASVITSISFDHMDILGHTLEAITSAKAGIIKDNTPVVIGHNPDDVLQVLLSVCKDKNAPIYLCAKERTSIKIHEESLKGIVFSIKTPYFNYDYLTTKLIGDHQLLNISIALTTIEVLRTHWNYLIPDIYLKKGLERTYWPCRCEYLSYPTPMLIDGAHNEASLDALMNVLKKYCSNQPITFLFGVLKDKDVDAMLSKMSLLSETIFLTVPYSSRALPLPELQNKSQGYFKQLQSFNDPKEAFEAAYQYSKKTNTLLCCAGSLYLSIPLRDYIEKNYN